MGKRKKTASSNETEDTEAAIQLVQEETAEEQTETKKKSKKSKKSAEIINTELPKQKSKKGKRSKQEEQIEITEDDSSQNLKTKKEKIKKSKEMDPKPKKVVTFDNPQEGTETSNNKKQYLNDEEAAVKDEDIDKFCDEIDEEDNMQYENWIKMIETTLHPPKKKT